MEKLLFEASLERCKSVTEDTTYLEMFFYSVKAFDQIFALIKYQTDENRIQSTTRWKNVH